ncbi:beta-D-glucosyl crocetin beta-1,6-glucosyltransferase-like [Camellia sinensis]|uniref:beta-D-glucosyl crocetin beta-1,6-glucosyltransferase-like n=1 Tax=Camellia sinensis TaxID=4442 RepID=UPI00103550C7|nr:beta-D-glucosyl crocetin beta-1,6-glucosyltransferase-like [Camellia sinensis]
MACEQRKIKVFMFPWLAHGHISPFLELAKTLSSRNFMVYLCSTAVNLSCIKRRLTEKDANSIQLVELHVPTLPGLPPNCHTTKNLPPHLMPTLKQAFDWSSHNFSKMLKTLKPDLLIYDTIQPWAPIIASEHDIPAVVFISTSATMTSYMFDRYNNPGTDFPFPEIHLNDYENDKFIHLIQSSENYYKEKNRFFETLKESSSIILIKSSREIEGKYIDHLSLLSEKKIVPVGPLVQASVNDNEHLHITEWLNKKDRGSTVFVSFGSEYFLTNVEMEEMAHGLELSNVNFIWVVRFPAGQKTRVEEALPKGFLERVGGRGLVIQGWAPQVNILEHPNVGGFVSHCGWSSVMEGIKFGVPIISVPMHLDQPINARLLSEIGVGVEIMRDENGKILREEVAKVIKQVVIEKSGEAVKKTERELSDEIRMREKEVVDGVVEELVKLCKKRKKKQLNGLSALVA